MLPTEDFFYIVEIHKKSSYLSSISFFYKPNRLKVAKTQPNKNLIRIGLKSHTHDLITPFCSTCSSVTV